MVLKADLASADARAILLPVALASRHHVIELHRSFRCTADTVLPFW
jgi:hypothetical protein